MDASPALKSRRTSSWSNHRFFPTASTESRFQDRWLLKHGDYFKTYLLERKTIQRKRFSLQEHKKPSTALTTLLYFVLYRPSSFSLLGSQGGWSLLQSNTDHHSHLQPIKPTCASLVCGRGFKYPTLGLSLESQ